MSWSPCAEFGNGGAIPASSPLSAGLFWCLVFCCVPSRRFLDHMRSLRSRRRATLLGLLGVSRQGDRSTPPPLEGSGATADLREPAASFSNARLILISAALNNGLQCSF